MFERVTVLEHIPSFCSEIEPAKFENVSFENVFKLEFVQRWIREFCFKRFMKSETEDNLLLMVEYTDPLKKTKSYAVIAYLSPVESAKKLRLPTWNPADYPQD